jgi:hypothetical protein
MGFVYQKNVGVFVCRVVHRSVSCDGLSSAFSVEVFYATFTVARFTCAYISIVYCPAVVDFVEVIQFCCWGFTAPVADGVVG